MGARPRSESTGGGRKKAPEDFVYAWADLAPPSEDERPHARILATRFSSVAASGQLDDEIEVFNFGLGNQNFH